tara:strand:- start:1465 stop:2565 length:1101 start_codon:yes stop_codon:yes gene_type:complete
MLINGKEWQTIWLHKSNEYVVVIDQTKLPHEIVTKEIRSSDDAAIAIKDMIIRGAPLIGVMGAYGLMLGLMEDPSDANLDVTFKKLKSTRPTAINLNWALKRVYDKVKECDVSKRFKTAQEEAKLIEQEDISMCENIGLNGLKIIEEIALKKDKNIINILTHCNAGWLATVNWGTALAPIYKAHRSGIKVHVWVDETRPRNQGASLTAFELKHENIPHTVIVDNAGGHLMQHKEVDLVIVGSDRTTIKGDVCNKIGTYLKALAANANNIPFYAALPISTLDWSIHDGVKHIPIESRSEDEVTHISGLNSQGEVEKVRLVHKDCKAFNPGFDVTPNELVTGLITEQGICEADEKSIRNLYEKKNSNK